MSRKSKAAKIVDVITGKDEGASEPESKLPETPWWAKMTVSEFKDALRRLPQETTSIPELTVLLATMRQAVRDVTLRQSVEDMTLDEQKIAGRRAPIYRGCVEAVLTKLHSIPKPNGALKG
jgi:hypothetical protein